MNRSIYDELYRHACSVRTVSTHSHHDYHKSFAGASLFEIIARSYPGWGVGLIFNDDSCWADYFEKTACRSDAYWMHKAIGNIYLRGQMLTYANRREADMKIRAAYKADPYFHERIITEICGIDTLILDEHRDPGDDHGLDFVRPMLRFDWALAADYRAEKLLDGLPPYFDSYIEKIDRFVEERVNKNRVVAFKLASAYDRPLDFRRVSYDEAEEAYRSGGGRALGDYIFYHTCELAERYSLPYQIHTGMGQLENTNAMALLPVLRDFPDVKFVLLHGSFPWSGDALALARTLPNVHLDLSWTYTLSTSMARRYLAEALDFVNLDRMAWGCDTWTAEEGYGALLAIRDGLSYEFARRIDEGLSDISTAKHCIDMLLRENALKLYGL